MVLKPGKYPYGDIWECLTCYCHNEEVLGILWVETRGAAKHQGCAEQSPQQRIIWVRRSVVLRLRNAALDYELPPGGAMSDLVVSLAAYGPEPQWGFNRWLLNEQMNKGLSFHHKCETEWSLLPHTSLLGLKVL